MYVQYNPFHILFKSIANLIYYSSLQHTQFELQQCGPFAICVCVLVVQSQFFDKKRTNIYAVYLVFVCVCNDISFISLFCTLRFVAQIHFVWVGCVVSLAGWLFDICLIFVCCIMYNNNKCKTFVVLTFCWPSPHPLLTQFEPYTNMKQLCMTEACSKHAFAPVYRGHTIVFGCRFC